MLRPRSRPMSPLGLATFALVLAAGLIAIAYIPVAILAAIS